MRPRHKAAENRGGIETITIEAISFNEAAA